MKKSTLFIFGLILTLMLNAENLIDGHEYANLGLSVKWATMNVGAATVTEYGNYYAYGEIVQQSPITYTLNSYKWYNNGQYTKYCFDVSQGVIDNKYVLDADDDIATYWGGKWRMPTKEEWEELISNCKWKRIAIGEYTQGFYVYANNDSIYFPAAGAAMGNGFVYKGREVYYASATLDSEDVSKAIVMYHFDGPMVQIGSNGRYIGVPVRPVWGEKSTSVTNVKMAKRNEKVIVNGQLFIQKNDQIFNIIGQRMK